MHQITIELPDENYEQLRIAAERTGKSIERVVSDWVKHWMNDEPIKSLNDDQVLILADMRLPQAQQDELQQLLALNSAGHLDSTQQQRLDELMRLYDSRYVRKAQAMAEAVRRGLRPQTQD